MFKASTVGWIHKNPMGATGVAVTLTGLDDAENWPLYDETVLPIKIRMEIPCIPPLDY